MGGESTTWRLRVQDPSLAAAVDVFLSGSDASWRTVRLSSPTSSVAARLTEKEASGPAIINLRHINITLNTYGPEYPPQVVKGRVATVQSSRKGPTCRLQLNNPVPLRSCSRVSSSLLHRQCSAENLGILPLLRVTYPVLKHLSNIYLLLRKPYVPYPHTPELLLLNFAFFFFFFFQ